MSSKKNLNYVFLIKVDNYTGKSIVMNIIDQIPVSNNEDIEITNINFSREPQKQTKKGIVKWHLPMKSKETVTLKFSFTVSAPKEKEAAFFRTKLPPAIYLQNALEKTRNRGNQPYDKYLEPERERKGPAMRKKMY